MLSRRAQFLSVFALAAFGFFIAENKCHAQIAQAGVEIDADGILRTRVFTDPSGALTRQRKNAARAAIAADVMRDSKLRKISLNRLEAALAKRLEAGQQPTEEMQYLVGLTKITHVFYYPESKDIVIAGPAEGFYEDIAGRVRGLKTEAPALQLEDLVTALRAYGPKGNRNTVIGVSIDPTQEGLQKMQQYLVKVGRNIRASDDRIIVQNLKENLGLQTVSIRGVSPNSHFAQVLVEADYRMKLIGIGLQAPRAKIPSYVSKANPRDVSRNALQRWYFQPTYDCVRVSEDDLAMEMVNSSVELVGADELVGKDGVRIRSGRKDRASQAFCTAFTKQYQNLARNEAIYAELQNMCDMAIVAAYIQHQDYFTSAGWNMPVFGDEKQYSIENHDAPKQVETAVNAVWKQNLLMTPIGGGVTIQARQALTGDNLAYDQKGGIHKARNEAKVDLKDGQWWWD